MSTLYLGYDPGGNGNHGVAAIDGRQAWCDTMPTAKLAIDWFLQRCGDREPTALGIDTLTLWSTGPAGWRPADRALRATYPTVRNSIAAPNLLYGAMPINGIAVALELRKAFPKLRITETHPKVLYYALTGLAYNFAHHRDQMVQKLLDWGALDHCEVKKDHEWDALLSAYAARQWATEKWQIDLHQLPASAEETLIPAHGTEACYAWPTEVPQAPEHPRAPHMPRQDRELNAPRRHVDWESAVEILNRAGHADAAKQIAEYRSTNNTKWGWDGRLKKTNLACWTLVFRPAAPAG